MPEPRHMSVRTPGVPVPLWPSTLPLPQETTVAVAGPTRAQFSDVLTGPTRARLVARTAPPEFFFSVFLTPQQMQIFEGWYLAAVRDSDGEFYARWIGGARVVAFVAPYSYEALGRGYVLTGHVVRTRIDPTVCDEFIGDVFGAIYRDDGVAPDIYRADLAAADIYADSFDLSLIAGNEC